MNSRRGQRRELKIEALTPFTKTLAERRRSEPLLSPFDKAVAGCLFGDDSFVKRIKEWLK